MSSTRRLGPSTATGGIEGEGERRERVQRTGANFRLARALSLGFYARSTRSAFRTEGKKRKRSELARRQGGCQAERPIKKSYGLLEPVRGRWLLLISAG